MRSSSTIPVGAWLLLGAAIAAVIGALLPWARINLAVGDSGLTATVNGTEGDGVITLVLGVALGGMAVLALATRRSTVAGVVAVIVGAAIVAIAVIDIVDVNRAAGDVSPVVEVSVGAGLWVTLVAGAVGLIGGVLLLAQRRRFEG
jgi:hypothetical protein